MTKVEVIRPDIRVGDIVIMEMAGGWGYHPENNGCYAVVTAVRPRICDDFDTIEVDGYVLNPNNYYKETFETIPVYIRSADMGDALCEQGHWTVRIATCDELATMAHADWNTEELEEI